MPKSINNEKHLGADAAEVVSARSAEAADQLTHAARPKSNGMCPDDGEPCFEIACDEECSDDVITRAFVAGFNAPRAIQAARRLVFVVTCLMTEPPFDIVSIVGAFDNEDAAAVCVNRCTMENTYPTRRFFLHQARIETATQPLSEASGSVPSEAQKEG